MAERNTKLHKEIWARTIQIFSCLFVFFVAILVVAADDATAPCQPSFPYQDGWLGGDAAYSVPLAEGKSLWLFGDSLIQPPSKRNENAPATRDGAKFVRNCLAISTCDAEHGWQIKYYWRNQDRDDPAAFFKTSSDKNWHWPLDGFMYQGRLYLALSVLKDKPGQGICSFECIGVRLAKISNPLAPPDQW